MAVTVKIGATTFGGFAVYASKFPGKCANCGGGFKAGAQIAYKKDKTLAESLGLGGASVCVHYPCDQVQQVRECPTFTPSQEQNAIGDAVLRGKRHIVVKARAGTGKTTTVALVLFWLLAAVKTWAGRVCMLVFGSKNAADMGEKVPPGVQSSTLHSFGRSALLAAFPRSVLAAGQKPGRFEKFQRPKTSQLLDLLIPLDTPEKSPLRKAARIVPVLVSQAKKQALLPNQRPEIDALIDSDLAPIDLQGADRDIVVDLACRVLEASLPHGGELPLHDFDDMVWIPSVLPEVVVKGKPLVWVDEVQDCGPCDVVLIEKMLASGSRIGVVGDDQQACMGFRGGQRAVVQRIRDILAATPEGVEELPLTINRRCGQVHIRNVQWHCPDIKPDPQAPQGTLEAATLGQLYGQAKAGHCVLVRTNALGIAVVRRLRALRIPAVMRGKGDECQTLIRRLEAVSEGRNMRTAEFLEALEAYYNARYTELSAVEKPSKWKLNQLAEDCDTLRGVALSTDDAGREVEDVKAIRQLIESLYDDNAPKEKVVTVSTIHRAKGLEWFVVWFLPLKTPHPLAGSAAALEQEHNLIYIRGTRVRADKKVPGSGRLIRVDGDPCADGADKIGPDYSPPVPVPPESEAPARPLTDDDDGEAEVLDLEEKHS